MTNMQNDDIEREAELFLNISEQHVPASAADLARARAIIADDEEYTPQLLAWGGESSSFDIITISDLQSNYENAHYSGWYAWTDFALISPLDLNEDGTSRDVLPMLIPVHFRTDGVKETDDQDFIHQEYVVEAPIGVVVGRFSTRIDGRV